MINGNVYDIFPSRHPWRHPNDRNGDTDDLAYETGVSSVTGLGTYPTGNNVAYILTGYFPNTVWIRMKGWVSDAEDLHGRSPKYFEDHFDDDPAFDEPIWFSRIVSLNRARELMYPYGASDGNPQLREGFVRDLGQLTGFEIMDVQTVQILPVFE